MESGLAQWVQAIGYVGIFAVVFVETGLLVGFALPGDSLLITVGILAAAKQIELAPALALLFVASFLGNNLGYWLGYKLGPTLVRRVKGEHLERTRGFMARFGVLSLLVGPYVPVVRALVPFTCGLVKMPWGRFALLTLVGSVLWTQGLTLAAYYVGSRIPHLERYVYLILIVGVSAGLVPALFRLVQSRLRAKSAE